MGQMRAILFVLISLEGVSASVGDACWFVAARFTGALDSNCEPNGKCSNIYWNGSTGRFVLTPRAWSPDDLRDVSCQEAEEAREALYSPFRGDERVRASAEPYGLAEIRDVIIPGFKLMLFSEIPIEAEVLSAMERVDMAFVELTANDLSWNNQKENYLKSEELTELWKLFELLVQRLMISSHRYDLEQKLPIPFVEFMMKMISLLGVYGRGEERLHRPERFALLAAKFLESNGPGLNYANNAVKMAKVLTRLIQGVQLSLPEMLFSPSFVSSLYPQTGSGGMSATQAMLRHQIRDGVCHRIQQIIRAQTDKMNFQRLGITLIELCLLDTPSHYLIRASVELRNPPSRQLPSVYNTEDIYESLVSGDLFKLELLTCSTADEVFGYLVKKTNTLVHSKGGLDFKPQSEFSSRDEFEVSMRVLGRALGMTLRYCSSIAPPTVDLRKAVALSIYGPVSASEQVMRATLSRGERQYSRSAQRDLIQVRYFEPAFFVRIGIADIIGPAGVSVFLPHFWDRYFRRRG